MANGKRVTPSINSKGIFEIESPYVINTKGVYEVIAIREFPDLWAEHVDIYTDYYKTVGLEESIYDRDVKAKAAIVTLLGEEGVIHIPDTFIISYPELGIADYLHVVLSVNMGAIHRSRNLKALQEDIAQLCSKHLGVKAQVKAHSAPLKDVLTLDEAKELEKTRRGLIDVPDSDHNKYLEERQKRIATNRANNERLKKLMQKNKDILPGG